MEHHEDCLRDMELILDEEEPVKFRIGATFFALPLEGAQQRVQAGRDAFREELAGLRERQAAAEQQLAGLKRTLEAKFGDQIRLEAA